jgi:hypothetical protein
MTQRERPAVPEENIPEATGQVYDMMRTSSDDGTVPPTAQREGMLMPPTPDYDRTEPGKRYSSTGAPEPAVNSAPDPTQVPHGKRTPLEEFAARTSSEGEATPDPALTARARRLIEEPVPGPAGGPQVPERDAPKADDRSVGEK